MKMGHLPENRPEHETLEHRSMAQGYLHSRRHLLERMLAGPLAKVAEEGGTA